MGGFIGYSDLMATVTLLVTLEELRIWTREPIDTEDDMIFAEAIIAAVSLRIAEELEYAPIEEWALDPENIYVASVKSVAVQVARRTYLNPDQEVRTAAIGPIGGVAYLEDFAQALALTVSEQTRLAAVLKATETTGGTGGLWTARIERDDPLMVGRDIVLQDDMPLSSGIVYGAPEDAMWFTPEEPAP